jgi:hypothetical protein
MSMSRSGISSVSAVATGAKTDSSNAVATASHVRLNSYMILRNLRSIVNPSVTITETAPPGAARHKNRSATQSKFYTRELFSIKTYDNSRASREGVNILDRHYARSGMSLAFNAA